MGILLHYHVFTPHVYNCIPTANIGICIYTHAKMQIEIVLEAVNIDDRETP